MLIMLKKKLVRRPSHRVECKVVLTPSSLAEDWDFRWSLVVDRLEIIRILPDGTKFLHSTPLVLLMKLIRLIIVIHFCDLGLLLLHHLRNGLGSLDLNIREGDGVLQGDLPLLVESRGRLREWIWSGCEVDLWEAES